MILRISAGLLVGVLFMLALSIRLSDHYMSEEQRLAAAGDHRGAMQSIRTAARLDPFSPEPLELQSYLLQTQGDDRAAAEALREAISRDPHNFALYLLLGNLQASRLNDLAAAEKSYREALRLNPHATMVSDALAQVLVRENKLRAAGRVYQQLEDDHKITVQGLYDLGRIYVRTGKPEKGLRYIRQARFRLKKMMRGTSGADRARLEELSKSMQLAMADALVVEGKYAQARHLLQHSDAAQAPAILQLIETDPAGYRRQVENSAIY